METKQRKLGNERTKPNLKIIYKVPMVNVVEFSNRDSYAYGFGNGTIYWILVYRNWNSYVNQRDEIQRQRDNNK